VVCSRALRGVEPHSPQAVLHQEITRAAPARDDRARRQAHQDSNPGRRGWSSSCCRYTTGLRSGRPASNGRPPGWRPGALPKLSYVRMRSTPGWSRTSDVCRIRAALSTELRALRQEEQEPPAGVEPAPRPYKGRVLAVDTTEARWRRWESNPRLPRCKRSGLPQASPGRCERVESNHHSTRPLLYRQVSSPVLSVRGRKGWPAGLEPAPAGFTGPDADRLHHGHHGAGTTGLEPALLGRQPSALGP
jgi:hypothetical protein